MTHPEFESKRFLDVAVALSGLVLLAPVFAIVAVLIRLDSTGPAIFRQSRLGRGGEPFTMLKFRTMRVGTADVPTHEAPSDSLTRAGRLLRRTKLDELPQLVNVLRGEMSLVGPRPGLPIQAELATERARLGVSACRPGITGPAQLAGIDMSDPIALARADAAYLDARSLTFDLRCIVATAFGGGTGDRIFPESMT